MRNVIHLIGLTLLLIIMCATLDSEIYKALKKMKDAFFSEAGDCRKLRSNFQDSLSITENSVGFYLLTRVSFLNK